jgi:membrane protein implicated in regulation of membrane protease activity
MEWLGRHLPEAWLGLAVLLGIGEMLGLELMLLMMAVGAVAGMVAALLGLPVAIQVGAFAASSAAMLFLVRPKIVGRLHQGPELRIGHSKLVGHQGTVTEAISSGEHGRIKLDGEIWSAAPYDEYESIGPGETVEVLEIRGATAYVVPVPRLES